MSKYKYVYEPLPEEELIPEQPKTYVPQKFVELQKAKEAATTPFPWEMADEGGGYQAVPTGEPDTFARDVGKEIGSSGPQIAAAMAGQRIGLRAAPYLATVPVAGTALAAAAPIAAESVFGMAGEAGAQLAGINEPDMGAIALAGVAPPTARLAWKAGKGAVKNLTKHLPGVPNILHSALVKEMPAMAERYLPQIPSSQLYWQLDRLNPNMNISNLVQAAQKLLTKEELALPSLQLDGIKKTAKEIIELGQSNNNVLPFNRIRANAEKINSEIQRTAPNPFTKEHPSQAEHGAWKKLKSGLKQDLTVAAQSTPEQRLATNIYRRVNRSVQEEIVADEITDILSVPGGGFVYRDGKVIVNFDGILTRLSKNKDIERILGKKEFQSLLDEISKINDLTPIPPPKSERVVSNIFRTGGALTGMTLLGTGAGYAVSQSGYGAQIGAIGGMFAPAIIAGMTSSKAGRYLLKKALQEGKGSIDKNMMGIFGAYLSSRATTPTGKFLEKLGVPQTEILERIPDDELSPSESEIKRLGVEYLNPYSKEGKSVSDTTLGKLKTAIDKPLDAVINSDTYQNLSDAVKKNFLSGYISKAAETVGGYIPNIVKPVVK